MWLVFTLLSVAGGLMMYLINEQENLFEILDDRYLIKNLIISIVSVALFLFVSYQSSTFIYKMVPLQQSKMAYYLWYFILQFLISGGLSLLTAIGSTALIVYANSGNWLGNTNYFSVDIYFVILSVVFVQLILFLIYFFVTFIRYDKQGVEHVDYVDCLESDYIELLQEVAVLQLEMGTQLPEKEYLQELDGIDLSEISFISSENKIRYIQSKSRGKTMYDGYTLAELKLMLPPDQFFIATRSLIISRQAVKSYNRLPNYHIELELDSPLHLKIKLSETATKFFKIWY